MQNTLKTQKCQLIGNNTGLGAHFVDLADRMLKRNGKMAFVLPLTTIVGNSWHKVRRLWAKNITMSLCLRLPMQLPRIVLFVGY